MIINENLFNDLFLESHKELAIQSLRSLNNCGNMIIVENSFQQDSNVFEIKSSSPSLEEINKKLSKRGWLNIYFTLKNKNVSGDKFFNTLTFIIIANKLYNLSLRTYIGGDDKIFNGNINNHII